MQDRSSFRLFRHSSQTLRGIESCGPCDLLPRSNTALLYSNFSRTKTCCLDQSLQLLWWQLLFHKVSSDYIVHLVSLVASSASSKPYIFFCSILVKLFLHSKIATVGTNDFFNKTFCRREEGLKMQDLYLQENPKSFCFYFHNRKLKSERA